MKHIICFPLLILSLLEPYSALTGYNECDSPFVQEALTLSGRSVDYYRVRSMQERESRAQFTATNRDRYEGMTNVSPVSQFGKMLALVSNSNLSFADKMVIVGMTPFYVPVYSIHTAQYDARHLSAAEQKTREIKNISITKDLP